MMGDFSVNAGRPLKADPSQTSNLTQQSNRSSFIQKLVDAHDPKCADSEMVFDESRFHDSNIMRESSRGLDKIRKSVIQQQSERYLMKRGRKSNSRGSIPNIAANSFQSTRNMDTESQQLDQSKNDASETSGNKPRDDAGSTVVKKVPQTQLGNMPRKI